MLGFSNGWYPLACATAWAARLPSGRNVQVIAAPAFVATKLEAFAGRGQGDYLFSHDLADITSVVDGRDSLLVELEQADSELRRGVAEAIGSLLAARGFLDSPAWLSARRRGQSGAAAGPASQTSSDRRARWQLIPRRGGPLRWRGGGRLDASSVCLRRAEDGVHSTQRSDWTCSLQTGLFGEAGVVGAWQV